MDMIKFNSLASSRHLTDAGFFLLFPSSRREVALLKVNKYR